MKKPTELNIRIGNQLRSLLEARHIRQIDLANAIYTTPQNTCQICTGLNSITVPNAIAIADVLGVSLDLLLCRQSKGELSEITKICAVYAQDGMSAREAMDEIMEVLK